MVIGYPWNMCLYFILNLVDCSIKHVLLALLVNCLVWGNWLLWKYGHCIYFYELGIHCSIVIFYNWFYYNMLNILLLSVLLPNFVILVWYLVYLEIIYLPLECYDLSWKILNNFHRLFFSLIICMWFFLFSHHLWGMVA